MKRSDEKDIERGSLTVPKVGRERASTSPSITTRHDLYILLEAVGHDLLVG